jgi:hypothetical protein
MADFRHLDKLKFEKLFGMSTGYVIDFSDRTFQNFILENLQIDIYEKKYNYGSGSKANRLRGFWQVESSYNITKLNSALLEYWKTNRLLHNQLIEDGEQKLYEECLQVNEGMKHLSIGEHIDAIQPNSDEKDFSILAKSIRESIERNEPEVALDRLHTFIVKYIRQLCDKNQIKYDKEKALHSFYGEYVKHLKSNGLIESEMTERILKSSISVLESFNQVRNNQSFAHDNPILNYQESMLIFKNISSIIEFLDFIESKNISEQPDEDDELPF